MDAEIVKSHIDENPGLLACEEFFKQRLNHHKQDIEALQTEIANNGESGHMWVIAQKQELSGSSRS